MLARCTLLLVLLAVPSWAGKRIVMQSTYSDGEKKQYDILIDATRMRFNLYPNESSIFVVAHNRSELFVLNPIDNTYGVLDIEALEAEAAKDRADVIAEKNTRADGSPAGTRIPKDEVVPNGERRIRNIRCSSYKVLSDGELEEEFCLASPADLGLNPQEFTVFTALRVFSERIDRVFGEGFLPIPFEGIPIQSIVYSGGQKSEEVLESIEDVTFGDSVFSVGDAKLLANVRKDSLSTASPITRE